MSYHSIHSVGEDGAVDDTLTSFTVTAQVSQLTLVTHVLLIVILPLPNARFIQVQATALAAVFLSVTVQVHQLADVNLYTNTWSSWLAAELWSLLLL